MASLSFRFVFLARFTCCLEGLWFNFVTALVDPSPVGASLRAYDYHPHHYHLSVLVTLDSVGSSQGAGPTILDIISVSPDRGLGLFQGFAFGRQLGFQAR